MTLGDNVDHTKFFLYIATMVNVYHEWKHKMRQKGYAQSNRNRQDIIDMVRLYDGILPSYCWTAILLLILN